MFRLFYLVEPQSIWKLSLPWIFAAVILWTVAGSVAQRRVTVANDGRKRLIEQRRLGALVFSENETALENVVWVRVRDAEGETHLEVGTRGYETILIQRFPYRKGGNTFAIVRCTQIAQLLEIEDKGYCGLA